jgi:hypothetical protein
MLAIQALNGLTALLEALHFRMMLRNIKSMLFSLSPKSEISSNIHARWEARRLYPSTTDPVAAWNKDIYELELCATVDQRITWLHSEIGLLVGIVIE